MTHQREVEIRFKLTPDQREELLTTLKEKGWKSKSVFQKDVYYCNQSFIDACKEKDCPYVVRIRESGDRAKLAYKSFTDDGSWVEHETGIENPSEASRILEGIGLGAYLTIRKDRLVGKLGALELTIDAIESLGDFMEMEILTDDVKAGQARLIETAKAFGVSNERLITKGYVQLMEAHLRR